MEKHSLLVICIKTHSRHSVRLNLSASYLFMHLLFYLSFHQLIFRESAFVKVLKTTITHFLVHSFT